MDEISPKVFRTKDIKASIEKFAQENSISVDECDFTLVGIENYVRDNATNELELIKKELLQEYLDKDKILNEHITFHQVYKIKVFQAQESPIKLLYKIDFGDYASHPKLLLSPHSKIPYKAHPPKEILNLVFKEFNKIKASHKILINIFDDVMKKNLRAFVKYLYAGKFKKRLKIALFDGIEPAITREATLIYWYKKKESQSAVIEVDANEVLIEFKKPLFGRNGLNAFGEEIGTDIANNGSDLDVEIDTQSILIEEDDNAKLYKSKKKGFVHFDKNKLSIDNTIKVSKISRNNVALASEEENNIEVVVSQHDTNQDSVGEGVTLTSETIHINGFVGAGSTLEAMHLNIDGATHQDSKQEAKYAKINRHKGTLRCHEAQIKLLEGGEVHATNVEIEACLGGSIYAQNVTIGQVKNNLKVYASHSISIKLVSGEDNLFKINYRDIPILKSKVEHIHIDIEDLKYHLEEALRHNKKEAPSIKEKIRTLQSEEKKIKESYKDAQISIEKKCNGLNTIIFTIDEEHELSYKTQPEEYSKFFLELHEDTITLQPVNISLNLQS